MFLDTLFTIVVTIFTIAMIIYTVKRHAFPWRWLLAAILGFCIFAAFIIVTHTRLTQENPLEVVAVMGLCYFFGYEIINSIISAIRKPAITLDNIEQAPPPRHAPPKAKQHSSNNYDDIQEAVIVDGDTD